MFSLDAKKNKGISSLGSLDHLRHIHFVTSRRTPRILEGSTYKILVSERRYPLVSGRFAVCPHMETSLCHYLLWKTCYMINFFMDHIYMRTSPFPFNFKHPFLNSLVNFERNSRIFDETFPSENDLGNL